MVCGGLLGLEVSLVVDRRVAAWGLRRVRDGEVAYEKQSKLNRIYYREIKAATSRPFATAVSR